MDSTGAVVASITATYTMLQGFDVPSSTSGGNGDNDARMFSRYADLDADQATMGTVSISNIPFSDYDLYVYIASSGNTDRGGGVKVGPLYKYARQTAANPTSAGAGYDEGTSTDWTGATTDQGNYVRFANLSGSTLNFDLVQGNFRMQLAGFQVVSVAPIPEPASIAALGIGTVMLLPRRRRA